MGIAAYNRGTRAISDYITQQSLERNYMKAEQNEAAATGEGNAPRSTAKNGDKWTGETQDGFYIYSDCNDNLYESKERPAYRISMDNAVFGPHGIEPFVKAVCALGDGGISKFADKIIEAEPFPSILQSAEDQRRQERNAQ